MQYQDFFAEAFPPLRPAALCCAVVPPCFDEPPDPDFLPPRLDAPGEFAMRAARCFDMPLSLRASYCFSFLTLGRFPGIAPPPVSPAAHLHAAGSMCRNMQVPGLGLRHASAVRLRAR